VVTTTATAEKLRENSQKIELKE